MMQWRSSTFINFGKQFKYRETRGLVKNTQNGHGSLELVQGKIAVTRKEQES